MESVLDAHFRDDPEWAVRHHLDSYRLFVRRTLPDALRTFNAQFIKSFDTDGAVQRVEVEVGGPEGREVFLDAPVATPAQCRATMASYVADLRANVIVRFVTDKKRVTEKRFPRVRIGALPVMVRSVACPLNGASPEAMVTAGESAADVGGYFIMGGREKVVVTQERMRLNTLRTSRDSNGHVTGILYAAGNEGESKLYPKRTNFAIDGERRVSVKLVRFNDTWVPLHTIFRALGVETDRDILAHLCLGGGLGGGQESQEGAWAWMAAWVRPSLAVAQSGDHSQEAALDALAARMRYRSTAEALKVLVEDLFPNQGASFRAKAAFLAHVVRQLASTETERVPLTDYDAYMLKRLEPSGDLLGKQFRNAFDILRISALGAMQDEYVFGAVRATGRLDDLVRPDNLSKMFNASIVDDYLGRYMRGVLVKEGVVAESGPTGVVQELSRTNYLSTLSHLRRVHTPMDASLKLRAPRALHVQQYGVMCPYETPEGAHIGLIKSLAMLARITAGSDEAPVRAAMADEGVVSLEGLSPGGMAGATSVFLNGSLVGACTSPGSVARALRLRRRAGVLDRDISVRFDVRASELHVQCDEGRIVRPLVINPLPGSGGAATTAEAVVAVAARFGHRWDAMVGSGGRTKVTKVAMERERGMLEYIDVDEGFGDALVAMTPADVGQRADVVTHVEIHPASTFSAVTGMNPFIEHNYAPRNLYACGHAKQAIGVYATNFRHRVDAVTYVGWGMQLPLVTTRFRSAHGAAGAKLLATGQNLVVAIAPVAGFNQEDSIVLNRASVERGALRVDVYKGVTESEDPERGRIFGNPSAMRKEGQYVSKLARAFYGALDADGMPRVGTLVGKDDAVALLGRVDRAAGLGEADATIVSDRDHHGVVDLVQLSGAPGSRKARIRLRQTRPPNLGDKLASRYSQKGVVGAVMDPWDLPRTADGVVPDVFFNPHAFPTRRTMGQMLEAITGKVCALEGIFGDATAFVGTDAEEVASTLEASGLDRYGDEVLYDGQTGTRMPTKIFVGLTQVGRLKLMSEDKMHSRSTGPKSKRTMQPAAGRARRGGLRVGEMERDVMVCHGMSSFTRETFTVRSDGFQIAVCRRCGATRDGDRPCGTSTCRAGDDQGALGALGEGGSVEVEVPYAFNLFRQELEAVGIGAKLIVDDSPARPALKAFAEAVGVDDEGSDDSDHDHDDGANGAKNGAKKYKSF